MISVKKINAGKIIEDHFNEKLWDIELNDYRIKRRLDQLQESMNNGFNDISNRVKELKGMLYGNNTTELRGLE